MDKNGSTNTKLIVPLMVAAVAAVAVSVFLFGPKDPPPGVKRLPAVAAAPTGAPAASAFSKEQAVNALMALPEVKTWSAQIDKESKGKVHGALIEYDAALKKVGSKEYWQLSFVENGSDAAHRRESFLVANSDGEILVEDFAADKPLTLAQWRAEQSASTPPKP